MKQRVVFLLGAGASKDADLPLASELTGVIIDDLNSDSGRRRGTEQLHEVMNYVVGNMIGHRGRSGISPDIMPDIESVVSAVELLNNRNDIELNSFIQNWDPSIDLLDRQSSWNPGWENDLRAGLLGTNPEDPAKLETGLKGFVEENYKLGISTPRYSQLMAELLHQLKRQLELRHSPKVKYLNPLVQLGRHSKVTIATINYDLTIETAAKARGIQVSRGIDHWNDEWRLQWGDQGVQLIKLHGSIDWGRKLRDHSATRGPRLRGDFIIKEMLDPSNDKMEPFVVFGKREKLRPEGPFSELRSDFMNELKSASHLVIIGYSFGDNHINELIRKWMNTDLKRKLVIVDPNFSMGYSSTYSSFKLAIIQQFLLPSRSPSAKPEETRVLLIRKTAKDAIPDLCLGHDHLNMLFLDSASIESNLEK